MRYVVVCLFLCLTVPSMAQDLVVELDADGLPGNGPDTVFVDAGDSLAVDVWVVWQSEPMNLNWTVFGIYLLDNGLLDFVSAELLLPPNWQGVCDENGDTVVVGAGDFLFTAEPDPPVCVYSVIYRAVQETGPATLEVDLERSGWSFFDPMEPFAGSVGAVVVIGEPTSAEPSSWGGVKALFR